MAAVFQLNLSLLQRRAWWVIFGSAVVALLSLIAAAAQFAAIADVQLPISEPWQAWMMGDQAFLLISAALLATTLMWLFWLYRAVANLQAVSAPAMTFSPTAAVVWSLVPIISLVMQFFILRATWQATMRRMDAAPLLVTLWAFSTFAPAAAALVPTVLSGNIDS